MSFYNEWRKRDPDRQMPPKPSELFRFHSLQACSSQGRVFTHSYARSLSGRRAARKSNLQPVFNQARAAILTSAAACSVRAPPLASATPAGAHTPQASVAPRHS